MENLLMEGKSALLRAIEPIIENMRDAHFYPNNNSSIVVVEGDIWQIMNLPQKLAELGYRLQNNIQIIHNVPYTYREKKERAWLVRINAYCEKVKMSRAWSIRLFINIAGWLTDWLTVEKVKWFTGRRTNGVATFVHGGQFRKIIQRDYLYAV